MRRSDFIFKCRIRNWPEYNRALISRGSLTLWVDEQAVSAWRRCGSPRGRGRPRIYSDTTIVGVKLASREFERQPVEALVKSQVLNRMSALGMPRSERISVG